MSLPISSCHAEAHAKTMTPEWPDINGIDTAKALLLLGGDKNLFFELLRLFIEENKETVNKLEVSPESVQSAQAYKVLHKLKGQAGSIGATDLQEASAGLINAINSGSADLNALISTFEQAHSSLCDAINLCLAEQTHD